jgi:hypothetical protein
VRPASVLLSRLQAGPRADQARLLASMQAARMLLPMR